MRKAAKVSNIRRKKASKGPQLNATLSAQGRSQLKKSLSVNGDPQPCPTPSYLLNEIEYIRVFGY
jgi:hypothetical protein